MRAVFFFLLVQAAFTQDSTASLKKMFQRQERRKAAYLRAGGTNAENYFKIAPQVMDKVVAAPEASKCDDAHCETAMAHNKIQKFEKDFAQHKQDLQNMQNAEAQALANMNPDSSTLSTVNAAENEGVEEIKDSEAMTRDRNGIEQLKMSEKLINLKGRHVATMRFGAFHKKGSP
jgi:hypothetical protein